MAVRFAATRERRRRILAAALGCFSELGYARTTMADICRKAQASTGSVYHHFKGKEQLAAGLYVEGIRHALGTAAEALRRQPGAEDGVKALVGSYMTWIQANPEMAAFCLRMRGSELLEPATEALAQVNREMEEGVLAWMAPHLESGALPVLEPTLYWAVLMGPSDHVAREWARDPERIDLERYRPVLEDAAWTALRALRDSQRA